MSENKKPLQEPFVEPKSHEELVSENRRLLTELEVAYSNMELILEESSKEKQIAYSELERKLELLENLYHELSRKENMLIHMEKLSSIGEFITEIVHELRNPLNAISIQAQMAAIKEPSPEVQERFQIITDNIKKMANLLNRFRALAYKGKEDFKAFDLNRNVTDCLVTIEIIKPKEMVIETALCKEQLMVKGDPYQTNQIFLNIAKNAFDAMRKRGQALRITTKRVESKRLGDYEEMDWVYCQQEKEWERIKSASTHFALVGFEDQGVGMSQTLLKEIFHPFFTTKERGQGTGLGLSICRDITLRHGGNLTVKSEIDKGTTFEFLLPMTTED